MARTPVNPQLVEGRLLLDVTSDLQRVRAKLKRMNDIMDFTRAGPDFAPLGVALGCSAAEAEELYSRYTAIAATMNGADFMNLSKVDQG